MKVLDFGISKAFDATGAKQQSLTSTSMTLGSPLYMSPEQVRSSKTVDARTDVWALGIIAYELLAGVQPFEAETVTGLCAKIVADQPPPLRSVRPDVPPAFEAIVLRCLEKLPAARYQSVGELAAALRPFASSEGRASVARIARTGGGLRPTLASAQERVSQSDAGTPSPSRSGPSDVTAGYAETVASWQESADRRGRQVKTASAATFGLLAIAAFTLVATKWPRAAAPPAAPPPVVSAASVIDVPAPAVAPAPTAKEAAAIPSETLADAKPAEPAASASASSAHTPSQQPRHPVSVKTPVSLAPSAKTADDLLQDRK